MIRNDLLRADNASLTIFRQRIAQCEALMNRRRITSIAVGRDSLSWNTGWSRSRLPMSKHRPAQGNVSARNTLFSGRSLHDGRARSLSLQDSEPLLHLAQPRTVDRQVVDDEPRVLGQSRLHWLARVPPQVVQHEMDRRHRRRDLSVQLLQGSRSHPESGCSVYKISPRNNGNHGTNRTEVVGLLNTPCFYP